MRCLKDIRQVIADNWLFSEEEWKVRYHRGLSGSPGQYAFTCGVWGETRCVGAEVIWDAVKGRYLPGLIDALLGMEVYDE